MTGHRVGFPSVANICANFKRLGYAAGRRIPLYCEKFKVVSDPMSSIQWGCSNDDEERLTHSPPPTHPGSVLRSEQKAATALATIRVQRIVVEQGKYPWTNRGIKIGARARRSRTHRVKVREAIPACRVNWGIVMRI